MSKALSWKQEELVWLKANYTKETKEVIMDKFPNRTWGAIKRKGQLLKCEPRSANPWKPYEYKEIEGVKNKKCRECETFYPLDINHFHKKCDTKDKFHNICKKCRGYDFTPYVKIGYQICKKCSRELPLDYKYFPKVVSEKNFRQVCRECSSKYSGFLKDDYKRKLTWTKEDNLQFIKLYPNYTNRELVELFYPELTYKQLMEKAYLLKTENKSKETQIRVNKQRSEKLSVRMKGKPKTIEQRKKLSETKKKMYAEGLLVSPWVGRIVSEEEKESIRRRTIGKWAGKNNPRVNNPLYGENNGRWQGGITNLSTALRENIYDWKQESMKLCKYKCLLTGGNFDNIHHLIPFNNIIKMCLNELELEVLDSLGKYAEIDRDNLINSVKDAHKVCGYGICLNKDIHKLFHDNYSYIDFNISNFKDFIKDYFDGIYDSRLDEKNKSINSKMDYEGAMEIASFYYLETK